MSGNIAVNSAILAERATALKSVAEGFNNQGLRQIDIVSTITANQGVRSAFDEATQGHGIFSNALNASATQIIEIGDEFFTIDSHGARSFTGAAHFVTQN